MAQHGLLARPTSTTGDALRPTTAAMQLALAKPLPNPHNPTPPSSLALTLARAA